MTHNRNAATPTPSQTRFSRAGQPIPILALGQRQHLALPGNVHLRDFHCISESAHSSLRRVKTLGLVSSTWETRYDPPAYLGLPIRSRCLFGGDRWSIRMAHVSSLYTGLVSYVMRRNDALRALVFLYYPVPSPAHTHTGRCPYP